MTFSIKRNAGLPLLLAALMLFCGGGFAAPTKAEIDLAVAALEQYDYDQPREPLARVEQMMRETPRKSEERAHLERQLVRQLEAGTTYAGKFFICRLLWLHGTDVSAPALCKMLLDADEKLVQLACYALRNHRTAEVDRALRQALTKTEGLGQIAIINLVGDRRDAKSDKTLIQIADGKNPAAAEAATAALGKLATDDAVKALAEFRRNASGSKQAVAFRASLQCARELAAKKEPDAARALYQELSGAEATFHVRRGALVGRLALGGPDAANLLVATLRGSDARLRATAIANIHLLADEKATLTLIAELPKLPAPAKALLVTALAERKNSLVRPAVEGLTVDPDARVRVAALRALASAGDASSVKTLADAVVNAAGADERAAAATSLRKLQGAGVDAAIIERLPDLEAAGRVELIAVLVDRQASGAGPILLQETARAELEVRKAAYKALGRLADAEQLPALIENLRGMKVKDAARKEAEGAVAAVARRTAEPPRVEPAAPVLAALAAEQNEAARCSLLRVLGGVGGAKALRAVVQALDDKSAAVGDTATRELAGWPDAAALEPLRTLLRETKDDTHRVLALRGRRKTGALSRGAEVRQATRGAETGFERLGQCPDGGGARTRAAVPEGSGGAGGGGTGRRPDCHRPGLVRCRASQGRAEGSAGRHQERQRAQKSAGGAERYDAARGPHHRLAGRGAVRASGQRLQRTFRHRAAARAARLRQGRVAPHARADGSEAALGARPRQGRRRR